MKYTSPPGSADPNAPYVTGNPVTKVKGSPVPAEAIEYPQRELDHLISFAGMTSSNDDLQQVRKAIAMLIESAAPGLATLLQPGLVMPDGTTLTVDAQGKLSVIVQQQMDPVGGIRFFEDAMPRPGYVECNAGIVTNFSTTYPQMAAYLETPYGQSRLVTLAQYEALHVATWATLADGTKVGWNGIGGVAKFYWDKTADTLKMPDLQDMFRGAAGPALGVGGVQGDQARSVTGYFSLDSLFQFNLSGGAFKLVTGGTTGASATQYGRTMYSNLEMSTARVGPTGPTNAPRRWGALACCWLGQPAS